MRRDRRRGLAALVIIGFTAVPARPQVMQAELVGNDTVPLEQFGTAVALQGDVMVVGSYHHVHNGIKSGSAYVFERNLASCTWSQVAELLPSNGADGDDFGLAVDIDGNYIVIGAHVAGKAYVFNKDTTSGTWGQFPAATLVASDPDVGAEFGKSVAISGSRIVVGSDHHTHNNGPSAAGAAYVFEFDSITQAWIQVAELRRPNQASGEAFGDHVDVEGDRVVVSAWLDQNSFGSAWIFGASDWTALPQQLMESSPQTGEAFGSSVSLSGARIAVGAAAYNKNYPTSKTPDGRAFIFVLDPNTGVWTQEGIPLLPSDPGSGDNFGYDLRLSGDRLLVGAQKHFSDNHIENGSAYVFDRTDATGWTQTSEFSPDDAEDYDSFAESVALSGDQMALTAPHSPYDYTGVDSGSVYIYSISCGTDASWSNYGAGFSGTLGVPMFTPENDPVLGTTVSIDLSNSAGTSTLGFLVAGFQEASPPIPINHSGNLLVIPAFPLIPVIVDPTGITLDVCIPDDADLCGLEVDAQVFEVDYGPNQRRLSCTAGLKLILGD